MEGGGEGFFEKEKGKKQSGRVAMEGGGEGFPAKEKGKKQSGRVAMEGGGEGFPEIEKEKKQSGSVAIEGGGEGFPEIEKEKKQSGRVAMEGGGGEGFPEIEKGKKQSGRVAMEGGGEGFPEKEKGKKQSGRVAMEGGGEGFPEKEKEKEKEKEDIFVSISRKIGEAYAWLKVKLISLFKLFSESIAKALLGLKSFVTSCCEKLREVLSGINTQLDDHFGKKKVVVPAEEEEEEDASILCEMKMGVVPEKEKASLLIEMKILVEKVTSWANQYSGIGINSLEMKAALLRVNRFLDLSEGFIELLKYANEKPLLLIPRIVDGFFIYCSNKKTGRVMKAAGREGKAAMAIDTLISLILSSPVLV